MLTGELSKRPGSMGHNVGWLKDQKWKLICGPEVSPILGQHVKMSPFKVRSLRTWSTRRGHVHPEENRKNKELLRLEFPSGVLAFNLKPQISVCLETSCSSFGLNAQNVLCWECGLLYLQRVQDSHTSLPWRYSLVLGEPQIIKQSWNMQVGCMSPSTFERWPSQALGPRPLVLSGLTIRDSKLDRAPCEGMSFSSLAVVKRQSDFLSEFWKRGFPYWVSNPILQIFRGRLMGMERWHGRCRPPAHSHWLVCTIVPHLKERHKPHSLGLDWM